MFVRNTWYAAAIDTEIGRDAVLGRKILGEHVAMYRKQDGTIAAIEDRCSHRFYPLSKGSVKGDVVVCGYHGLEFDCTGACTRIPGQDTIPPGSAVKSYPVAEKWKMIWLWMGDPAMADESLIPNLWTHDHPEWCVNFLVRVEVKGDYRLLADNLLDPSHVAFLHQSTLGSDVAEIPHETDVLPDRIRVTRWTIDKPAAPIFDKMRPQGFNVNVDRWQIMTFWPPNFMELDIGSCETGTGAPQGNRSQGIEWRAYNIATPADEDNFHYFLSQIRNFELDKPEISRIAHEQVMIAVAEDIEAIELVHAGQKLYPDHKYINTRADGAGLRAHRMINDILDRERAGTKAA